MTRIDWPSVTLAAVALVCMTVFATLVLFRAPELLTELDFRALAVGAAGVAFSIWQMARRNGFFKAGETPPSPPSGPTYGGDPRRGTADDPGRGWGAPTDRADRRALPLALVFVLLLPGCGASALQTQARAQLAAGTLLAAAGDVEREARRAELAECVDQARETGDRAAGEACVGAVERAHAPFHVAHDSSRSALVLWVEATELAERAGGGDDLLVPVVQAAARFVLTYDPIAEAMRQLGLDAPPLPTLLSTGLELGGAR